MNMIKRIIWFVATMLFRIVRWIAVAAWRLVSKRRGKDAHDKVQLWEGGPYWATTNIGAEKPEDYGLYFWWGDTVGYKRENDKWVASDGASSDCHPFGEENKANIPSYAMRETRMKDEGWIASGDMLAPEHDAAHVKWGGTWRMPTRQELCDLEKKCDWTWGTMNGVNGYTVRGKGDFASAFVFLPCGGSGHFATLENFGKTGAYWSSVPKHVEASYVATLSYASIFRSDLRFKRAVPNGRYFGLLIRPVQGITE